MESVPNKQTNSPAYVAGILTSFIAGEFGAAAGVIGGLWAAYLAIESAQRTAPDNGRWQLLLVGGALFVAVTAVCSLRRRR